MNPRRVIAAAAAVMSVLVVQGAVLNPLTAGTPVLVIVSLPAVLVAAIGLTAGPSAGMSIGFATGLLADLGSTHPAGILALCWLGLGLGCGLLAERSRPVWISVPIIAVATGLIAVLATTVLSVAGAKDADISAALRLAIPTMLADAILAAVIIYPVRGVLHAQGLRAPHPMRMPRRIGPTRPIALGATQVASDG